MLDTLMGTASLFPINEPQTTEGRHIEISPQIGGEGGYPQIHYWVKCLLVAYPSYRTAPGVSDQQGTADDLVCRKPFGARCRPVQLPQALQQPEALLRTGPGKERPEESGPGGPQGQWPLQSLAKGI
jgi:hypothetical protein